MDETTARVLIMVDEGWGANAIIRDGSGGMLDYFREYGWELTAVSPRENPKPCPIAARVKGGAIMPASVLPSSIRSVASFDGIIVLPGQAHAGLIADPDCLRLLREADAEGLAVGAVCRGVRVLAAAGILAGRHVTGHADYAAEYAACGAVYHGYADQTGKSDAPPPVTDGHIVTSVRGKFYREALCVAFRDAVSDSRRRRRRDD